MKNPNFRRIFHLGFAVAAVLAPRAWAGDQTFRIGGQVRGFYHDPVRRLTLSRDCVQPRGALACAAFAALDRASLAGIRLHGGENPGAVICRRQLGATVVIGTDAHGDQNSFCRFADGSLVSNGTLLYFARNRGDR